MSTAADVIEQTSALLQSVEALLETNAVEAVVDRARAMDDDHVLREALEKVAEILASLQSEVRRLIDAIEDPLRHAQALSGLVGLLQPLMSGLEHMIDAAGEDLADVGLEQALKVTEPVADGVRFGRKVLRIGDGVLDMLPSPAALDELDAALGELIAQVETYIEALT